MWKREKIVNYPYSSNKKKIGIDINDWQVRDKLYLGVINFYISRKNKLRLENVVLKSRYFFLIFNRLNINLRSKISLLRYL
jgi:hypothetical protein